MYGNRKSLYANGMSQARVRIDFDSPISDTESGALHGWLEKPMQVWVAQTHAEIRQLLQQAEHEAALGKWCVGWVSYEASTAFDPSLKTHAADQPLAWFAVFETFQNDLVDQAERAEPLQPHEYEPRLSVDVTPSKQWFDATLNTLRHRIGEGDYYQVNLTAPLSGHMKQGNIMGLYQALRRAQPAAYSMCIESDALNVASVSPELFFDWQRPRILLRPMKGTAPRDDDTNIDQAQAQRLKQDEKERAENVMIVDLIRNDVSRIAQPHSVKVNRLFEVRPLPTVWQMTSDVEAQTREGTSLLNVFDALFPCGSVTGAPKVQAMHDICSLEPVPRGLYCGAMGVIRPGGHATFNVAIRTVTEQAQQWRCGIGSGITSGSSIEGEWNEWQHKQQFLMRAAKPFDLLETLRLQDGVIQHLNEHLQRMQKSAQHFGFVWNDRHVRGVLGEIAKQHPKQAWRVRLLLNPQGHAKAQIFAFVATPASIVLQLANRPFTHAHTEFVSHKTTRREHYDAFAPAEDSCFDTLLYNTQGELTECTRGNVALQMDGVWLTPPLSCGLLPGIGRQIGLQRGELQEAVLTLADLQRANQVMFINSLRGKLLATVVQPHA